MCLEECQHMAHAMFVKYAHTGIHILTKGHSCLTDQGGQAPIHSSWWQDHNLLVQTARKGYTNHFQGSEQCWLQAAALNHPGTTGAPEEAPVIQMEGLQIKWAVSTVGFCQRRQVDKPLTSRHTLGPNCAIHRPHGTKRKQTNDDYLAQ